MTIPSGATNINIKQQSHGSTPHDGHYLAVRRENGDYILNGNFSVSTVEQYIPVLGLCWNTVAHPPHWRDFRASANYRNQSQYSCSPPLGNPSHRRSNIPSTSPKPCLLANPKTKRLLANLFILLGCHSGSRVSGLNAPKRVVQDGPGEMWNVKTMLASIQTTAIKISGPLISGPVQTYRVPYGK